jgi:uncharacterized membrane protein YeaQ/YmgE (transglycosylase-associated protein family)
MKRYLIFAAVGPVLGGFWLLLTNTLVSGYWSHPPTAAEVGKLLKFYFTTLQYSYLFGLLPALMIAAIEDILFHIKRIGPALRILIVGVVAFFAAEFLYGSRGQDTGPFQYIMFGLVGFIPGTVNSWLVHRFVEEPTRAAPAHENGGQNVPAA